MKGAFVCPAACELFSLFIRLFYQDGETLRGLRLRSRPGGGWRWVFFWGGGAESEKKIPPVSVSRAVLLWGETQSQGQQPPRSGKKKE